MKLIRKKEVWLPTWQGIFLFTFVIGALVSGFIFNLYPFLAQTDPQSDAEFIIVEGWLNDAEFEVLSKVIKPGQVIVTTGGPVTFGDRLLKEKTYAEVTASRLRLAGFDPETIICAPAPDVKYDRTYASAVAAREALLKHGILGKPCNIYSMGAHSRRSHFLYTLAFGADYPLGVVSLESKETDLRHWWRSSLAFKHVTGEFIAWIYTLFSSCKYA